MVKGGMIDPDCHESVGGHFVYNNTFFNSNEKNDIIILNKQNDVNINYETVVLNNLSESLSGARFTVQELSSRMISSSNFNVDELEPYLEDWNNRDFRPINIPEIVDAANMTYRSLFSSFNPSGDDSLTKDIGAMLHNEEIWKGGITWNDTNPVSYTHLTLPTTPYV